MRQAFDIVGVTEGSTVSRMTPEAKLKTALREGFHKCFVQGPGVMTGAIGVALGQKRGLPDRYFGIPGHFTWIEAKAGEGKLELKDSGQVRQCSDLDLCGQRVMVLWCENPDLAVAFRRVTVYQVGRISSRRVFSWQDMKDPAFWAFIFGDVQQ
jgi:hypothetical protein